MRRMNELRRTQAEGIDTQLLDGARPDPVHRVFRYPLPGIERQFEMYSLRFEQGSWIQAIGFYGLPDEADRRRIYRHYYIKFI